jgi:pre-mRNA-processing factor 39
VDLLEQAKAAYERAANSFLPKDRCGPKIALALLLEEEGDIQKSRETYQTILQSSESLFGFMDGLM